MSILFFFLSKNLSVRPNKFQNKVFLRPDQYTGIHTKQLLVAFFLEKHYCVVVLFRVDSNLLDYGEKNLITKL